jgi:hypothetical protein
VAFAFVPDVSGLLTKPAAVGLSSLIDTARWSRAGNHAAVFTVAVSNLAEL